MKTIEVDEELYRYIARQTQHIGESASEILRRLLGGDLVAHDADMFGRGADEGEAVVFQRLRESGLALYTLVDFAGH